MQLTARECNMPANGFTGEHLGRPQRLAKNGGGSEESAGKFYFLAENSLYRMYCNSKVRNACHWTGGRRDAENTVWTRQD